MNALPVPAVVDRAVFQAELDGLRLREKAHTRAGDAIAAARRRLPMVEVDAGQELVGPDGTVTLLDAFEGRSQLVAYYFSGPTGVLGCWTSPSTGGRSPSRTPRPAGRSHGGANAGIPIPTA